jgi:deferrochelatase/peroxidase EfeB
VTSYPLLETADIQPGVLEEFPSFGVAAFGCDFFLDLKGPTPDARRSSLQLFCELLTQSQQVSVTVGLTSSGLRRLGVHGGLVSALNMPFAAGAPARASLLSDPDPADWDHQLGNPFDIILLSTSNSTSPVEALKKAVDSSSFLDNQRAVDSWFGADRQELFGFRDGVTNPPLAGTTTVTYPGNGARTLGGWRPLAAGEIICGYPNEAGFLPGPTVTHEFTRGGTYLVWRKLAQHVDVFARIVNAIHQNECSETFDGPYCSACAARIMGRKQNGDALNPSADGKNGFDYSEPNTDPTTSVDINSHIRRANPRASAGFAVEAANQHRILRRGMRWSESGREGLLFRCFQSDISNGFEFIQRTWFNDGEPFGEGRIPDVIAGRTKDDPSDPVNDERTAVWFRTAIPCARVSAPTTPLATAYAFVPGIRTLRRLSETDMWMDPVVP